MCGSCRISVTERPWYWEGVGDSLSARRRARMALAEACDRVYRVKGIQVKLYSASETITVRSSTGRSFQAQTLREITESVERIAGELPDPFDISSSVAEHT